MATKASLEERIAGFVDDILRVEGLEEAFNLYIVHRPDLEAAKVNQRTAEWLDLLKECSANAGSGAGQNGGSEAPQSGSAQVETALKYFVSAAASPARHHKFLRTDDVLFHLLEQSVARRVVGARQVCDAILTSDQLKPERTDFWIASFCLVRRIIGGVDYKGVREIMKICVDKVIALPSANDPNGYSSVLVESQLSVIHELLSYIFDRNAALLPGYFIVNEILKV